MVRTTLFRAKFFPQRATSRCVSSVIIIPRLRNAFQPTACSSLLYRRATAAEQTVRKHYYYRSSSRRESRAMSGDVVVLGLISINVAVTIGWMRARAPPPLHPAAQLRSFRPSMETMLTHFTTSTQHLLDGRYYTLLTAMFSQATLSHLGANMLGLYFFGRHICDVLGPKKFIGLYLASGVLSSAAAVYEQQLSRQLNYNLGASGAVNAITAMSILLFPHGTLLIFGLVPMPAWLGGSLFILKDAYAFVTDRQDGIGHVAHLSGAAVGAGYYSYLRRGRFWRF
ncbi:hypothetical protein CCR75_001190 [Bremia lactucae]|uniref:Peptidase S54 rhomboid domain-containing protein n=1 Tax=Bremia lactucae TaxID=4779 RepID=A0A976FPU9_BRELC|nr:hypothetical protein CCR75_001190 [Bremia lactucae]